MSSFAEQIGMKQDWPKAIVEDDQMSIVGLLTWANAYFEAAENLHFQCREDRGSPYYQGPVLQNVDIATELILKAIIRGQGKSMRKLR